MKAWKANQPGFENVYLEAKEPLPEIKNDYDVLIKVLAVGLNPVDYKRPNFTSYKFPYTLGLDACGIVLKRGNKVDPEKFVEGKTLVLIFGSLFNENGYFAEYTTHDSRYLSIVPEALYKNKNIQEVATHLAGLPTAAFTAYQGIFNQLRLPLYHQDNRSSLKIIKTIVVTGGAGGVGGFSLQFLKIWRDNLPHDEREKVKIITTCSARNFDYVKKLGATHAIDYNNENVIERLKELSEGEGIDIFIDNIGGAENLKIAAETLGFGGEIVLVAGWGEGIDFNSFLSKGQVVHSVMLGGIYRRGFHDKIVVFQKMGDEILKLYSEGKLDSLVSEVIEFEDIQKALLKIKEGHAKGKIVARVQKAI